MGGKVVSKNDGGIPWPIWAIVTILAAIIVAYATLNSTERAHIVSPAPTTETNGSRSRTFDNELQMKLEKKDKQIKNLEKDLYLKKKRLREIELSNNKGYNRTLSEIEITRITGDATWSEDGKFSVLLHNGNAEIQLESIVFEVSQKQEDGSVKGKQYSKQFKPPIQPLTTTSFVVEILGRPGY